MNTSSSLRVSSLAETPPLQASRWQRVAVLLSPAEMIALFAELEEPQLFLAGRFYPRDDFFSHKGLFFSYYRDYIDALSSGVIPEDGRCQQYFSAVMSLDLSPFYLLSGDDGNYLLRVALPVVQMQHHRFSCGEHKVHSMVYGQETISWGVQFSYPQLYIDPQTHEVREMVEDKEGLFRRLQRWLRHHSLPTPFIAEGKRFNVPIRLGKECFTWINRHPQLAISGLTVDNVL